MVGILDGDLVGRAAETTGHLVAIPLGGDAGIDLQASPVRLDAQDVVADDVEVPRSSAGQPGVLSLAEVLRVLAGDHLGVDVGLHLVQVGNLLAIGGGDLLVQVEGAVAVAHDGLRSDDPGVVVAEDARVLLVSRRIGGHFTQLEVVLLVSGLQQHDAVLGLQPFLDGLQGLLSLAVLNAHAAHDAVALGLDEDLAVVALLGADLVTECVIRTDEPIAIPASSQDDLTHRVDFRLAGSSLVVHALLLEDRHQFGADRHEHARDQHGFRHTVIGRVGVGEGLEALARGVGETVEVQAVVPVGAADQGQAMRALVVDHMVEAVLQVLQQGAAIVGVAVVGSRLIQDGEVAGLLDVGRCTGDQPQRIVIEAAADVVVALLGQGLVLMVAAAIAELGGSDIQDALTGALRDLVHEAQQILGGIAEAHAAANATLKHGGGTAHIEGHHALVGIPDVDHAAQLLIVSGEGVGGEQVIPVGLQRIEGSLDLLVGSQAVDQGLGRSLVDHARRDELLLHGHFHIAQDEVVLLALTRLEGDLHLMSRHGLPAGGHGIAHLAGHDRLGRVKAVVQAQEGLHVGIETGDGRVHGVEGIVIAALTVLGLVVDDAVLDLDFTGGEVALEVQHIVRGIPQAELHEGGQDDILGSVGLIGQGDLVHLGIHAHGHEGELAGSQTVLLAGDDGVAHTMTAGVLVQLGLDGLPAGIPHSAVVVDVEVTAAVIHRHIVVAVTGHAAEAGIPVEAVAAGGVADDAEELFASQVVDPGIGRARGINDILAGLVIEMTKLHRFSLLPQLLRFYSAPL